MNRVRVLVVLMVAIVEGGGLAYGTYTYLQNIPVKNGFRRAGRAIAA